MRYMGNLILALTALSLPTIRPAHAEGLPEDKSILADGEYARELSEARKLLVWKVAPRIEKSLGEQSAVRDLSRLVATLSFEVPTKIDEFENLMITEIDHLSSGLSGDELQLYNAYISSGRKAQLAELIRNIKRVEVILKSADASRIVPGIGQLAKVNIGNGALSLGEALVSSMTKPDAGNAASIVGQIGKLAEALEKQEIRQWEQAEPAVFKGPKIDFGPGFGGQPQ